MALKNWICPKCGFKLRAMGSAAMHRCPKTRKDEQLKEETA
jgi:tRNA(Ile2) C34 agmatinyltransferase TiaS